MGDWEKNIEISADSKWLNLLRFILLMLIVFTGYKASLNAQIVTYNRANTISLSGNMVTTILEDSDGDFWFGTDKGISYFDTENNNWKTYEQGFTNGPISNIIETKTGVIWASTHGDFVNRYNKSTDVWVKYVAPNGPPIASVKDITADSLGNLWCATYGSGISKFDGEAWTRFTANEGLASNLVYSVFVDKNNVKWFGTTNGVSKFNDSTWVNYNITNGLPSNRITSISGKDNGEIWFGTVAGVSRFNGLDWLNYDVTSGLKDDLIYALKVDRSNNVWASTEKGVSLFSDSVWLNYSTANGLQENATFTTYQAADSSYYIGHLSAGVSVIGNPDYNRIKHFEGLPNWPITSFAQDTNGHYWAVADSYKGEGLFHFDRKVWSHFKEANGFHNNKVKHVFCDKKGMIWVATMNGLLKYNLTHWKIFSELNDGLKGTSFHYIFQDSKSNLWFPSDYGVSKFDGISFTNYGSIGGLTNSYPINQVLENTNGKIWFSNGKKDIFIFDGSSWARIKVDLNINSMILDSAGRMIFTSDLGFYEYKYFELKPMMNDESFYGMINMPGKGLLVGGKGILRRWNNNRWETYSDLFGNSKLAFNRLSIDRENFLWISHGNNLSRVDLDKFESLPVGLEEIVNEIEVTIFPNPTRGKLTISTPNSFPSGFDIQIYNIRGQQMVQMHNKSLSHSSNLINLNIKGLKRGIYFVKIITPAQIYYQKIVKI